jgi:hypothetical protein
MKPRQLLAFLPITLILINSAAAEPGITYPFDGSSGAVLNPYMDSTFLEYLKTQSVYPVLDKDGLPLFYLSENPAYGCTGICDHVQAGSYFLGSKSLDHADAPAGAVDSSILMGSSGTEQAINSANAMRQALSGDTQALDAFERRLLENEAGALKSSYMAERYDSVWDYALETLQKTPDIYNSLADSVAKGDLPGSASTFEDYIRENFDVSRAFDSTSLYSALENEMLGQMQAGELMQNTLKELSGRLGKNMNTDMIGDYSELMKSQEFRSAMEKALGEIKKNPEAYEQLRDMAGEMMKDERMRQALSDMMKEMINKGDWKSVADLAKIMSELGGGKDVVNSMMEGFTRYMRDLAKEGKLEKAADMLSDPEMKKALDEAMKVFSQSILEMLQKYIADFLKEYAYVMAVVAVAAAFFVFYKTRI